MNNSWLKPKLLQHLEQRSSSKPVETLDEVGALTRDGLSCEMSRVKGKLEKSPQVTGPSPMVHTRKCAVAGGCKAAEERIGLRQQTKSGKADL